MEQSFSDGHIGTVVAIEHGDAVIRFQRSAMCAHCGGCLAIGDKEVEMRLPNTLDAQCGDRVSVSMQGRHVARASLVAYAIPLAFLVAGVGLGSLLSETGGLIGGVLGCAGSYFVLKATEKRRKAKALYRPMMSAIIDQEGDIE